MTNNTDSQNTISGNDTPTYKPFLPDDKNYLTNVAATIAERVPTETIHFEYLTNVLRLIGIGTNIYDGVTLDNLNPESVKKGIEDAFRKLSGTPIDTTIQAKLFQLWDYLAEEDLLEKSNLIFVFGGPGTNRVNEAVRLYKEGYGQTILFSGQKAAYMPDVAVTEAEYYGQLAEQAGVPLKDIILEPNAKNTPENVVNSFKILTDKKYLPESVILITLPYHMRRSYLTFKTIQGWKPKIIRHIVASAKYTRENYYFDKDGFSYVCYEYLKIYGARLMKHF